MQIAETIGFGAQAGNAHNDALAAVLPTGTSTAIAAVNQLIRQVAPFDSNVLILGESGTGKEVAARAIHAASRRAGKAFVAVNCGAIPSELLESELFGHEKGSFTGALQTRKGRFEMAEGGTIFLDEIGDMNPAMQVKLLRVLQERSFERVGSSTSQRCNVRVIAATHRNLEAAIANGSFREDLFYRLNVVPVEMPALRERCADLPALIASLAARVAELHAVKVSFSQAAIDALKEYRWPGNIRELGNLIERMAIQCSGQLECGGRGRLGAPVAGGSSGGAPGAAAACGDAAAAFR
jgi:sigma-54 dependent transcriptional regulator, flagellar regulatory protein